MNGIFEPIAHHNRVIGHEFYVSLLEHRVFQCFFFYDLQDTPEIIALIVDEERNAFVIYLTKKKKKKDSYEIA